MKRLEIYYNSMGQKCLVETIVPDDEFIPLEWSTSEGVTEDEKNTLKGVTNESDR